MPHFVFRLAVFVLFVLPLPIISRADIAIDVIDEGVHFNGDWTLGYEFIPDEDINLFSLGFFDDGANGLADAHQVGVWDSAGNLIVSATVDSSDPLTGKFRYTSVAPVTLTGGETYIIGGYNYVNDAAIRNDLGVTGFVDPSITITAGRWTNGGLAFPGSSTGDPNIFYNTVSFEFESASVPEPHSLGWLGLILGLAVASARRQNRSN